MVRVECPWCEEELSLPAPAEQDEQSCPNCLTSWSYLSVEPELAQAA